MSSPSSSSSTSSTVPFTISPKARAAPAVLMGVSPGKCTNTFPKENCPVHKPKVDEEELGEIMGRMSLSDLTNHQARSVTTSKPRAALLGPVIYAGLRIPFIRTPKVKFHFVRHAQVSYYLLIPPIPFEDHLDATTLGRPAFYGLVSLR